NPIGAFGRLSQADGDRFEIVGVVGDVRNNGLKSPPEPELYFSTSVRGVNPMTVLVRSDLPDDQVIAGARRVVRQINQTLVMENVRTMNEVIRDTVQLDRLSSLV